MHSVIKLSDGTHKVVIIRDAIQLNICFGLTAREAFDICSALNGSGMLPSQYTDEFLTERMAVTQSSSEAEGNTSPKQTPIKTYDH